MLDRGSFRMGAKKSSTYMSFLRGTVEDDSNFFGTNYFCVTQVLTSKLSRYLASLRREKSLFQVLTASVDSRTMSVYQKNPKCDAGYARAAHESQQIYSNMTFLRSIWS